MRLRNTYQPGRAAQNPWTRGLRFFAVLDQGFLQRNEVQQQTGTPTAPSNILGRASVTGYPGQFMVGTTGGFIDWDRTPLLPLTGSVTVIGRWFPTGGGNYLNLLGTLSQGGGATGFLLYFDAASALTMTVADTGSFHFTAAGTPANDSGYEYTAGGRFDSITGTVDVWKDGVKIRSATSLAKPWNTVESTFFETGVLPNLIALPWSGNVYWIAFFNRALTDSEMLVWGTQDPVDLIYGDEPIFEGVAAPTLPPVAPPAAAGVLAQMQRQREEIELQAAEDSTWYRRRAPTVVTPATPSTVFQRHMIPRMPVRAPEPQTVGGKELTPKLDPRVPRFSESVQVALNGLIRAGCIMRVDLDEWALVLRPRETTDALAVNNDVFYSTSANRLSYKDPSGVITRLT